LNRYRLLVAIARGGSRVWKGGVHFVEKVENKKKKKKKKKKKRRSRMSEGSSSITMKLKYIITSTLKN